MFDQNVVGDVHHEWVAEKPINFRHCWTGFGAHGDTEGGCFSDCCRSDHPFGLPPGGRNDVGSMSWEVDKSLRPKLEDVSIYVPGE